MKFMLIFYISIAMSLASFAQSVKADESMDGFAYELIEVEQSASEVEVHDHNMHVLVYAKGEQNWSSVARLMNLRLKYDLRRYTVVLLAANGSDVLAKIEG